MGPLAKMILGWLIIVAGIVWYIFFWKELVLLIKGSGGLFLLLVGLLIYLVGREEKAFIEEEKKLEEELKKQQEALEKELEKAKKSEKKGKTTKSKRGRKAKGKKK